MTGRLPEVARTEIYKLACSTPVDRRYERYVPLFTVYEAVYAVIALAIQTILTSNTLFLEIRATTHQTHQYPGHYTLWPHVLFLCLTLSCALLFATNYPEETELLLNAMCSVILCCVLAAYCPSSLIQSQQKKFALLFALDLASRILFDVTVKDCDVLARSGGLLPAHMLIHLLLDLTGSNNTIALSLVAFVVLSSGYEAINRISQVRAQPFL